MIVLIDNHDSFAWNLARHLALLGPRVVVVPSHVATVADLHRLHPRALVISPGPCTPAEAGCSVDAVRSFTGVIPILGVCLGHQVIAAARGASIVRAREPVHGRTSRVRHDAVNLFAGIPDPMTACRYHSLVVDPATLSEGLVAVAHDEEGTIMAVSDERQCVHGVQFHPESILTRHGFRLLANFLELAGVPHASRVVGLLDDHLAHEGAAHGDAPAPVERVVTF
jgi:anthranilate synthase/aminodeoxychorismate synthase-like glutamine amidotransferase